MSPVGGIELVACLAILVVVVLITIVGVAALLVFLGRRRTPPAQQGPQPGSVAAPNVCLACGAHNPPDGVFCIRCGEKLYEEIP